MPAANALRQGILSTNSVLAEIEKQSDWESILRDRCSSQALDDLELVLSYRIALTLWRLNRLIGFECHDLRPCGHYLDEYRKLIRGLNGAGARLDRALPDHSIEQVERYEAHLDRMFSHGSAQARGPPGPAVAAIPAAPSARRVQLISGFFMTPETTKLESEKCPKISDKCYKAFSLSPLTASVQPAVELLMGGSSFG